MDLAERNRLKAELRKMGIKGEYLDSWQPREDLWRHKPQLNNNGKEIKPAGAVVPNQPSDLDHKMRLAIRGILPWKPDKTCMCKGCRERDWDRAIINDEGHISVPDVAEESPFEAFEAPEGALPERLKCDDCDYVVKADNKRPAASLRLHRRKHKETVAA